MTIQQQKEQEHQYLDGKTTRGEW